MVMIELRGEKKSAIFQSNGLNQEWQKDRECLVGCEDAEDANDDDDEEEEEKKTIFDKQAEQRRARQRVKMKRK